MTRIVLTEEQTKLLNPTEAVEFCDPQGRVIGVIPAKLTPDELAHIRRAKDCTGPRIPSQIVHQSLQVLEDAWQREGPFGMERARAIVREFRESRGY